MKVSLRALTIFSLLLASCGGSVATSPTRSPTVAAATPASTASAPATVATPSSPIGASECTSSTATTRQVVERYFALSTSNDSHAVTDCFAQSWRKRNAQFAEAAALWSHSGPATDLVVTPVDVVNGCDRFRVSAQMPSNSFWTGQQFFSVGAEGGQARIYETATALANASATTLRCG